MIDLIIAGLIGAFISLLAISIGVGVWISFTEELVENFEEIDEEQLEDGGGRP